MWTDCGNSISRNFSENRKLLYKMLKQIKNPNTNMLKNKNRRHRKKLLGILMENI